jgi:hypothetical protein
LSIIKRDLAHKPDEIQTETRRLRPDNTRPSDITLLNYDGPGRHLFIDVSVISGFTSSNHHLGQQPGRLSASREADKFLADARSTGPIQHTHRLVPFIVEKGGRLGLHAKALLAEWEAKMRRTSRLKGYAQSSCSHRFIWTQSLSGAVNCHMASLINKKFLGLINP